VDLHGAVADELAANVLREVPRGEGHEIESI